MDEYPYPVTVEGKWATAHFKAIKNKLQIYFQSKKKANGGDCRVEVADNDTARATVYFKSEDVRDRVLAREDHEITHENESVKLSVSLSRGDPKQLSQSMSPKSDDTSDLTKDPPGCKDGPGAEESGAADKDGTTKDPPGCKDGPGARSGAEESGAADKDGTTKDPPGCKDGPGARSGAEESGAADKDGTTEDPPGCKDGPGARSGAEESGAADKDGTTEEGAESLQSIAVLLENVPDNMSRDLLLMLLEHVSGLEEGNYSLEIIWETNSAVVTFNSQSDAERFLTVSRNSVKLQKHRMTAHRLVRTRSIRVENLRGDPTLVKEMLELYFEKRWALPSNITMIPEEEAAIVTFHDTKIAETIPQEDHVFGKVPLKVYPYYESLGTALYGKDRPTWKMPEPFTESVHHAVWKYLLMKKQLKHINGQMRSCFCSVDMERPEVKLSSLPSLLRQKSLTGRHVDEWKGNALAAFRQLLAQYTAFECVANAPALKSAEKDIRLVVKEDGVLLMDASRGSLTVAGRAEDMSRIRGPVESIIQMAISQIERQRDGVSEDVPMLPAKYYILQQEGLQRAASDISPKMLLFYREDTKKLSISGLPAEILKVKYWILEKEQGMNKRLLAMDPHILDFLKSVDCMEMSQDLFTSQGISAVYNVEGTGVFLIGSSDSVLADAERKMKTVLSLQSVLVTDQEVLRMPEWKELNKQLVDTYNTSKKKTVAIQLHPQRTGSITVSGFINPVKEVSRNLEEFIANYSRVQEAIRVESCAVVQFIQVNKSQEWTRFAKADEVKVHFDPRRPRIIISGAHLYVQNAKASFQRMAATLCTDYLTVDKPGAKKYFLQQGSMLLSTVMKENNCVVVLHEGDEEEDDYEEDKAEASGFGTSTYCKVQTLSGILVSVSRADICSFRVDAVVNAANEDLQHIGGLALALLKAAGPRLQKLSDDHIANYGRLQPGDAIVTDSCNLPSKYVVHTVGPKFSDFDKKTAVTRLRLAVKESLRQAAAANCSTIAVPAVSSGVFGFPLELCVDTIAQAVREYCENNGGRTSLTEIHLVDNNDSTVRALAKAVNNVFMDLKPKMTVPKQADHSGYSSGYRGRGAWGHGGNRGSRNWAPASRGHGNGQRGGGRRGAGGRGNRSQGTHQGQAASSRGHHSQERGGYGRGDQEGILGTKRTQEGLRIVLREGNIQDQLTDVIVNTIADHANLSRGAVSAAILSAAGPQLQSAASLEAGGTRLTFGDVIVTDGYNLNCQKVFHAVCPFYGAGQAEEELITVIRFCLDQAEKLKLASLSFPALGTGNLGFPKALVSRLMLEEIQAYSRRRAPQYLGEVAVVVHPSDAEAVTCFTREFKGQAQNNTQQGQLDVRQSSPKHSAAQSQQPSASFGKVSSPSLGVYRMQMGQLTLEVSSGDITKETSDAIVNSSNKDFTLKSGVSKAILDGAGLTVQLECSQIVNSPSYLPVSMIMTSAGLLPCRIIIHIVGQNDPAKIKDIVFSVLKTCEENKFTSVALPALGTGQGGASPSAVADAMIDAVVDFLRKKNQRFVHSVKILVFQTVMVKEFHTSMRRREGQEVEEKSVFTKIKDSVTSFFKGPFDEERASSDSLVLEGEEFEPAVFQLCADNSQAVSQARKHITDLIVAEQAVNTISDKYISLLSQEDMDKLKALHRKLTVSIRLENRQGQDSLIHVEGLTRDVLTAVGEIKDLVLRVERKENHKQKAVLVSGLVEWQYQEPGPRAALVPFDIYTNCKLEEALESKQSVKIKINNDVYTADVALRKAVGRRGNKEIELIRKNLKDDAALPSHWEDMKGLLVKPVPLTQGSKEYLDVEQEFQKTGLTLQIISIERIQNKTLWQNYQILQNQLEQKNGHKNNERRLFHGTDPTAIVHINGHGFNRSYAGTHGAAFGNGSYFAVDPLYSAQGYAKPDTQGVKRMYLARVLVGDYCRGQQGMLVPPSKGFRNNADMYDSVTDNTGHPTMFVIFKDIQAYPEYLITFK